MIDISKQSKLICAILVLALAMMTFGCPVFAICNSEQIAINSEVLPNATLIYSIEKAEIQKNRLKIQTNICEFGIVLPIWEIV